MAHLDLTSGQIRREIAPRSSQLMCSQSECAWTGHHCRKTNFEWFQLCCRYVHSGQRRMWAAVLIATKHQHLRSQDADALITDENIRRVAYVNGAKVISEWREWKWRLAILAEAFEYSAPSPIEL